MVPWKRWTTYRIDAVCKEQRPSERSTVYTLTNTNEKAHARIWHMQHHHHPVLLRMVRCSATLCVSPTYTWFVCVPQWEKTVRLKIARATRYRPFLCDNRELFLEH